MIRTVAALAALTALAVGSGCSKDRVVEAGFWFDHVTFDLSRTDTERLRGAIQAEEMRKIESIARSELRTAYSGLRVVFSHNPGAYYRVRVIQGFPARRGRGSLAAAESLTLGPFGGHASVSFEMLASLAMNHAPPRAERSTIIEGIGRGIGRAAAHEFAHQILPGVDLHASKDRQSYEYRTADRAAQYYGPMHWDVAWPPLLKRLGR